MKIAYITAHAPYGSGETFILAEMHAILRLGATLTIIPRNPPREIFHEASKGLLDKTIWLPLLDLRILRAFLGECFKKKKLWHIVGLMLQHSRSLRIFIKNLAVLPKAVYLSQILKNEKMNHLHVHWGSTTATMAWIIAEILGIPWSMTLHRWDITEDNMLALKVARASFSRCISEQGRHEVLQIAGRVCQDKVKVLYMGVKLPETPPVQRTLTGDVFTIACPANLLPVKGHQYLVEACALLQRSKVKDFQCLIIGDGPLEVKIREQIARNNLQKVVKLVGRLPHNELLQLYEKNEIHAVVLPSIVTEDGEKEGIPVALMEAMAYGVPVVSTDTGGIPELLSGGAGLLVKARDPDELAAALLRLRSDTSLYQVLRKQGHERVCQKFNSDVNVLSLMAMMNNSLYSS